MGRQVEVLAVLVAVQCSILGFEFLSVYFAYTVYDCVHEFIMFVNTCVCSCTFTITAGLCVTVLYGPSEPHFW